MRTGTASRSSAPPGPDETDQIAYPARAAGVISVGATTRDRCLADYSNGGSGLDLVAPGAGDDATMTGEPDCHPERALPSIYQLTLTSPPHWNRFGYPSYYIGTSMSLARGRRRGSAGDRQPRHRAPTRRPIRPGSARADRHHPAHGRAQAQRRVRLRPAQRRRRDGARDPRPAPGANAAAHDDHADDAHHDHPLDPRRDQPVRTISTEHGAWWSTLFGTEPNRNRVAPAMPLLPTHDQVRSLLLGYVEDGVRGIADPRERLDSRHPGGLGTLLPAASSSASTSSRMLTSERRPGHPAPARCAAAVPARLEAETIWSRAPSADAIRSAWTTAFPAVSDPSVPTRIDSNIPALRPAW